MSLLPSSCLHSLRSPVHLHLALGSLFCTLRAPGVAPACRARPVSCARLLFLPCLRCVLRLYVLRLLVSLSLYAVLPIPCFPLPARRGIRLCVSWGLHGDAMFSRLWRCWGLGVSTHPYRPLAIPSQALDVVARSRYESLGGQHLIVAAIPGLSQERCCETTRSDFSVAWVPPRVPVTFVRCSGVSWESEGLM